MVQLLSTYMSHMFHALRLSTRGQAVSSKFTGYCDPSMAKGGSLLMIRSRDLSHLTL